MSAGVAVGLEHAVDAGAASVHDPLGDALVIEVHDLLAEVEVVHQRGSAPADLQRVVGVREPLTLRGGQEVAVLRGHLARTWRKHRTVYRRFAGRLFGVRGMPEPFLLSRRRLYPHQRESKPALTR